MTIRFQGDVEMTMQDYQNQLQVGDRVFWNDPGDPSCSRVDVITHIREEGGKNDDDIITLANGEVEANRNEIEPYDNEVVALAENGEVVQWNAEDRYFYACGESLDEFGPGMLDLQEKRRL